MGTSVQFHLGEKRSALVRTQYKTHSTTFYTIYPVNSRREVQRKLLYNRDKFFEEEGRQILSPNLLTTQELKHISAEE